VQLIGQKTVGIVMTLFRVIVTCPCYDRCVYRRHFKTRCMTRVFYVVGRQPASFTGVTHAFLDLAKFTAQVDTCLRVLSCNVG